VSAKVAIAESALTLPRGRVSDYFELTKPRVVLMVLVAIATVQLIAPGLGSAWFGGNFAPEGWTHAQRFTYLWTELIPVLAFTAIGVLFWRMGKRTRLEQAGAGRPASTPQG